MTSITIIHMEEMQTKGFSLILLTIYLVNTHQVLTLLNKAILLQGTLLSKVVIHQPDILPNKVIHQQATLVTLLHITQGMGLDLVD
jgi:hypothetical protein